MQVSRGRQTISTLGVIAAAAISLASGCASTPAATPPPPVTVAGGVNAELLVPEAAERMQLQANQIFVLGDLNNPDVSPEYPAQLLPLRLPDQPICVRFVVNRDGSVSDVVPVYGVNGCPSSQGDARSEFFAATLAAVSRWDFYSSVRCTFPPGTPDRDKCSGPGTTAEQVAITLAYRFVFSVRDGVGRVEQAKTGS